MVREVRRESDQPLAPLEPGDSAPYDGTARRDPAGQGAKAQ